MCRPHLLAWLVIDPSPALFPPTPLPPTHRPAIPQGLPGLFRATTRSAAAGRLVQRVGAGAAGAQVPALTAGPVVSSQELPRGSAGWGRGVLPSVPTAAAASLSRPTPGPPYCLPADAARSRLSPTTTPGCGCGLPHKACELGLPSQAGAQASPRPAPLCPPSCTGLLAEAMVHLATTPACANQAREGLGRQPAAGCAGVRQPSTARRALSQALCPARTGLQHFKRRLLPLEGYVAVPGRLVRPAHCAARAHPAGQGAVAAGRGAGQRIALYPKQPAAAQLPRRVPCHPALPISCPVQIMADKGEVWQRLVQKHGLQVRPSPRLCCAWPAKRGDGTALADTPPLAIAGHAAGFPGHLASHGLCAGLPR